jgi:hypothetical protein
VRRSPIHYDISKYSIKRAALPPPHPIKIG